MKTNDPHKTSIQESFCIVDNCNNYGKHKFPKNEVRGRQWIEAIKHLKPGMTLCNNSLICSDHFRLSVSPWTKTSVEVELEPTLSIQDELELPSSCIQVKLEELSSSHDDSTSFQNKELSSPPIQVELKQPLSSIQVKLEKPSSPNQDEIKQLSASIRVKKKPSPPVQDELKKLLSSVQVKQEKLSSPIQDKLEQPLTSILVKNKPLSLIKDELKQTLSSVQVKTEKPSSPIQEDLERPPTSVQSCIEIELQPLSLSIFKPNQIKANKSRALPTKVVKDQHCVVSWIPHNPYKLSKKKLDLKCAKMCRCVVDKCANKGRHQFPKDEVRKRQWLEAIKHLKPGIKFSSRSLICSDHFIQSDFSTKPAEWNSYCAHLRLRKSAIPSVFQWTTENRTKVEQEIQDTPSFNPMHVKATYSKAVPKLIVEEQNFIVPMAIVDPHEDPLHLGSTF